jgi:hypothetical protein|nr:MAG TPA: nucleoid-associated protein [Caudoviricetes sp.]
MADDNSKVVFDRLVIADEQGHLTGKPAEGVQQQIEQALAPVEKIPAGGAQGEVLARASNDGTQLTWRVVRDGVDGKNGRDGVDGQPGRDGTDGAPGRDGVGIKRIEPSSSGGATVVMTDDSTTVVPMEVKAQWTPELQARAQGWWISFNPEDAEASKKEAFGVPLIHADVANLNTPIPIVPKFPDVIPERRLITIPTPKQPGVVWKIDGVEAAPGDHVIPGEDRREIMLEATPEPGYVFSSSKIQFPVVFGSLQGRELVISEDPSKRTAGTALVPAVPENERATWPATKKNLGLKPNNGFGGSADVESVYAQPGTGLVEVNGETVPRGWVVTDALTLKPSGKGNAESELFITVGSPNATVEVDVAKVEKPGATLSLEWFQDHAFAPWARSYSVGLAEPGRNATMMSKADGVDTGLLINAGNSIGTWKFEFLNLSCTITAPSGARATHKWENNEDKHWGRVLGIRTSNNNVELGGYRIFMAPGAQVEDRGARAL